MLKPTTVPERQVAADDETDYMDMRIIMGTLRHPITLRDRHDYLAYVGMNDERYETRAKGFSY